MFCEMQLACYSFGMSEQNQTVKLMASVSAVFAAGILIGGGSGAYTAVELIGTHDVNEAADDAASTVHQIEDRAAGHLSFDADGSLRVLASLRPSDVEGGDLQWRISTGRWVQDHATTASLGLLATGRFADSEASPMQVVEDVVPKDTQKALKKDGYELTPVAPVACDATGTVAFSPWNYTNHVPADFEVRVDPDKPGAVVKIPLGVSQTSVNTGPYSITGYRGLTAPDISTRYCQDLPQPQRQPQDVRPFQVY